MIAGSVVDDLPTGLAPRLAPDVDLIEGCVTDAAFLEETLRRIKPAGVLHLAAKKSPIESTADPLLYAREDVGGA